MPELPEVETIRRQLEPVVRGRRILDAGAHPSAAFCQAVQARGAVLGELGRRGKYLIADLDAGVQLVIHLGMTGRLGLGADDSWRDDPYVRAWWCLGDETLVLRDVRRFGRVALVRAGEYDDLPTLRHMGPEPFDAEFTAAHLYRELRRSKARVKTQLLSQRPVAGIGNIYADEALWRAGVNPAARRISRRQAELLHASLIEVLSDAISHGGTTLRDYRQADGREGGNQFHLDCYGRAGKTCNRCGATLVRKVVDGRGTTFCATCQRP